MERAAEAEELLCRGGYAEAVARTAQEGGFCHNAYKGEALRQETDGRIFVGNFDKCSAELPLADLAAYIRRYFKKTGGDGGRDFRYAGALRRHCPLSERDMILLQGMLLYPEKFLQARSMNIIIGAERVSHLRCASGLRRRRRRS